jgi:hypothetical protein
VSPRATVAGAARDRKISHAEGEPSRQFSDAQAHAAAGHGSECRLWPKRAVLAYASAWPGALGPVRRALAPFAVGQQGCVSLTTTSSARQEANFRLFDLTRLNELCLVSSFDSPKGH